MTSEVEIRQYRDSDRENVRRFAAADEHERPEYLKKHPRLGDFRADGLVHYYDLEPESFFVAECCGEFVGNLLGAVDSIVSDNERRRTPDVSGEDICCPVRTDSQSGLCPSFARIVLAPSRLRQLLTCVGTLHIYTSA